MPLHRPGGSGEPSSSLWDARKLLEAALTAPESPVAAGSSSGPCLLRIEVELADAGDPMHWLTHQAAYPRVYFADGDKDVVVAGVGAAAMVRSDGAVDGAVWQQLGAVLGDTARARFYGGARFDSHVHAALRGAEWAPFGGCVFLLPLWELQLSGGGAYLACHLSWGRGMPCASFGQAAAEAREAMETLVWSAAPVPAPLQALPLVLGREAALGAEEWRRAVQTVLDGAQRGDWSKVVLAQRLVLSLSQPAEALHLLRCLLDAGKMQVAPGSRQDSNRQSERRPSRAAAPGPADASAAAAEPTTSASGASAGGAPAASPPSPSRPPPAAPPRHAYLFLLQPSADAAFLGCSPEKLFKIAGGCFSADALAGGRERVRDTSMTCPGHDLRPTRSRGRGCAARRTKATSPLPRSSSPQTRTCGRRRRPARPSAPRPGLSQGRAAPLHRFCDALTADTHRPLPSQVHAVRDFLLGALAGRS